MDIITDVNGQGKYLYVVVELENDENNGTDIQLWQANDDEHLKEQVFYEYGGWENDNIDPSEDPMFDVIKAEFDQEWELNIVHKQIGIGEL